MTVSQLKYIIKISESGSLSRASEELFISQPSLTAAVREVERELGITIFHRSGRGMTLTNDGVEFIPYARQVIYQYDSLLDKYGDPANVKKKFSVSTQHFSFAVKAFVEMMKYYDGSQYDFAIKEERTQDVIEDVGSFKSEIGVIYLSDFNRGFITKLLSSRELVFHKLIDCGAYAYVIKDHPLAGRSSVTLADLSRFPCLSFDQGDANSFYLSEDIISPDNTSQTVKVTDRATMLNLMVGLEGYTICSGIICEELNGSDYIALPIEGEESVMEIGYIVPKNSLPSSRGRQYITEMKRYLGAE